MKTIKEYLMKTGTRITLDGERWVICDDTGKFIVLSRYGKLEYVYETESEEDLVDWLDKNVTLE